MISWLKGQVLEKADFSVTLIVQNVGYEVFCSLRTVSILEREAELYVYTHYKADGVSLYGFLTKQEKELFLSLIKVDSVGPKSALNILSAAPVDELIELIEDADVVTLSKLPKISKKTAEHLVVKLKGKLSELVLLKQNSNELKTLNKPSKIKQAHKLRAEAQSALTHLGFKSHDVEKVLSDIDSETWSQDLQTIIRSALNDLSGNSL
ncbi:MAG: Holliday junction branch migration protein RuvA [Oligoflexia bacterium]|nr:Holliday junction branch migration protein RuvA [Oligoflexia bacterium]